MASLLIFVPITLLLLVGLAALLWRDSRPKPTHTLKINDFLPVHHQHFEDVDRRLSEYEEMLSRIQSERRELAFEYLAELRADFEQVTYLLNRAAKFLPELTLTGESSRVRVAIWFLVQYHLARLQIRLGIIPTGRLATLTTKVRFLARVADQFLNVIAQEHGLPILESDLNR